MRKEFVRRRLHHVSDQRYMGEKGKVGVRLPLLLVWLLLMRRRSVRNGFLKLRDLCCLRARRSEAGQEVEVQLVGTRADVRCQTMRASSSLLCLIVYMLFSSRTSSSYLPYALCSRVVRRSASHGGDGNGGPSTSFEQVHTSYVPR